MQNHSATTTATFLAQHALPKRLLTRLAGGVAQARAGALSTALIRRFVARYGVDLSEAEHSDPAAWPTFNAFFARALQPGARPLAAADWVCPVDGSVSQLGRLEAGGQLFQAQIRAKGHHYSAAALLGGDALLARRFDGGHFATLYLSPRDYHRIHMPCAGQLRHMLHVPGSLFSVNPATVCAIPDLFARNERVVCLFDTAHGPLALVLVGATIVGSMSTVWHGVVNPRGPQPQRWHYHRDAQDDIHLAQGAEMGRFQLGSTVVLLFAPEAGLRFCDALHAGAAVRMGQALAHT